MLEKRHEDDSLYAVTHRKLQSALQDLFSNGNIRPHLGIGFAIVSENVLNVTTWGGDYPSLMNLHIFTFSLFNYQYFEKISHSSGAYCCWEGEIVCHESKAWQKYLLSPRQIKDKRNYLENFFEGETSDSLR